MRDSPVWFEIPVTTNPPESAVDAGGLFYAILPRFGFQTFWPILL
jgi:hypothetical protein